MKLSYNVAAADCKARKVLGFRGDLEQICAELRTLGYEGITLSVRNPLELDQDHISRVIQRHGLVVPGVSTGPLFSEDRLSLTDPDPLGRQAAEVRIRDVIDLAARFGAPIFIARVRGPLPEEGVEDARRWMREGLLCVTDYGQQRGVRVLIEPLCHLELNNLNSVPETVAFVRSLGHSNLGIVADTFHMNIEDCCLPASLMAARDYLGHVHFADSNRRYPGAGHVPFGEVVEALHLIGYDGFITIEVKQEPDPTTAARRAARYVRALLDAQ